MYISIVLVSQNLHKCLYFRNLEFIALSKAHYQVEFDTEMEAFNLRKHFAMVEKPSRKYSVQPSLIQMSR